MYRIGIGKDIHPLVLNKELVLGTIKIPYLLGLDSYSDGDVVVHSLIDAILGAMHKGDIGKMFPDYDLENKGKSSIVFLKEIRELLKEEKFNIDNIDISIECEKPKLAEYITKMEVSIATVLQIEPSRINIKAGTREGLDSVGQGKAIEATSIVLLYKK